MSKRSWIIAVVFGLALLAEYALAQATAEDQPSEEESATNSGDSGESQDAKPVDITLALNNIKSALRELLAADDQRQAEERQQRESRDLEAQESMARSAELMFYATTATVLLTALALWAIVRTLHHTRRAADSADGMLTEARAATVAAQESLAVNQQVGQAQVRAYIAVRDVRIQSASAKDDIGIDVWFDLKNNGQTPAMEVRAFLISHSPSESKSNLCMFQDIAGGETAKRLCIKFFPNPNPFTDSSEGAKFLLPSFMLIIAHKIVLGDKTVFEAAMFNVENDFSAGAPRFEMMPNMFNSEQIEQIARHHYEFS